MKELKVLSPTAILGYGFPMASFKAGMDMHPDVMAVDAGSTDPGPYYLGSGLSFTDRNAVKRDLKIMIPACLEKGIPLFIGSAGGAGGAPHLEWNVNIVQEISKEQNLHFKVAVIDAEMSKETVKRKLALKKIIPLEPAPMIQRQDVEESVRIVGQMGVEPLIEAIQNGADVVISGRAYDPAVFAAYPIYKGYDPGLSIHLGKILECASIAATPGSGSDCMMGYLGKDYFKVEALNPIRKCTTTSVAAHTLYEKSNPYILPGPGGILDLTHTKFIQETERMVKVTGSQFVKSEEYTIKLEGVKKIGYRTIAIAGIRDPIMIRQIEEIVCSVRERVKDNFHDITNYYLDFKLYGKNGVMGSMEKEEMVPFELCMIIDAVSETQDLANTICSFARSTMLHFGYEDRISTAGNLAFPYSPSDFKAGEVYAFSVYNLMLVDDPCECFQIKYQKMRGNQRGEIN
jgi:hypothetical protein